ncbi:MAG: Ltp family lipoprotein, partial [Synergistaceae bacterium]|nr:Ltp family lipoprotein [Synergistaceae bacterium]
AAFGATFGETNALRAAKDYLEIMPLSYSGVIKQLELAKFSHSEAVYAADNCEANWNEQAAKAAKTYLEIMPLSRLGLIRQLELAGFSREQAVYGVEKTDYKSE